MATKSGLGYNNYSLPVGAVINYFGKVVPSGFLVCDGQILFKADYPQLFRVLDGIGYGQSTDTFTLPNLVDYFLVGSNVNSNTINAGSAGGLGVEFSITEANMPSFSTNSQNSITFNANTDGHAIITNNNYTLDTTGSPTQTFLSGGHNDFHADGSVTTNLTAETASYAGTGSVQTISADAVPAPVNYSMRYCIRADYSL